MVQEKVRQKRRNRILEAVKFHGDKCANCRQTFAPCVYDFHHVNPEEKEFTIGENTLASKKRFFEEVEKCILLCANCHRLVHYKDNNINGI